MNNKESKELAIFLAELANGINNIGSRWEWIDALGFVQAALTAPAAFDNIKLVDDEFNVWTPEEKLEVITAFKDRLKFENTIKEEEVEEVFENAVKLAKSIQVLIRK